MPESFKNPPSIPISPNSFSISTTCSPEMASCKSFLINVVFPAPRKPEIISIFVILISSFFLLQSQSYQLNIVAHPSGNVKTAAAIFPFCNSSALHLLARLQRTRSIGRPPYEDSDRKVLMKASFQRFFCLNLRMAELLPLFSPPKHLPCAKDHKGRQIYHHHAGSGRCGKLIGCHHSQQKAHKG